MSEPITGTGRETSGVPVRWGTPQDHAACGAVTRLGLVAALREVYPQWSVGDLAELADSILARLPAGGPPVSGTWRTGRRVGRTIYAQQGDAPSDSDPLIGVMDSPELAAEAVAAVNERKAGLLSLAAWFDRKERETTAETDAHRERDDDDAAIMAAGASSAWRDAARKARLRARGGQSGHSGPFPVSQGAPDGTEALRARIRDLEAALYDVLAHFTEHGHPGFEAVRTGWQPAERVKRWRVILHQPQGGYR